MFFSVFSQRSFICLKKGRVEILIPKAVSRTLLVFGKMEWLTIPFFQKLKVYG